jgi:hypothetical protein
VNPRSTVLLLLAAAALGAFVWFYEIRGGEAREKAAAEAKRLFPGVESDAVSALAFRTSDGQDVRLEKRGEEWRIAEPLDRLADDASADGMASSLAELASEAVIEEPQPAAVYGLDAEDRIVRFRAGDAEHELRIGKTTPVGGQTYAATGADAKPVYTVPTYRVSGFKKSLDDLREKRVLRFDRNAIQRIEARWPPDGRVVLEKEGEDWKLREPLAEDADGSTVETLLSDLSFLRADHFLDAPDAAARKAVEQREFVAVLSAAAAEGVEPQRFELVVGGLVGEGRVARGSEADVLYQIAPERLQDFPRKVVDYRFKDLAEFSAVDARKFELVLRGAAEAQSAEATVITGERGEEGWKTEPEPMQPGKASRLVSEVSHLRAKTILAESMGESELAALGLAPPAAVVRVWADPEEEGGEAKQVAEVQLGKLDAEHGIPARVPGRDTVYALDGALAEHVPVSLEAFRERFVGGEEEAAEPAPSPGPAEEEAEAPGD